MREFAVIGGGIGGCSIAALLHSKNHDVILIEKERTLGGCASTFKRSGKSYNAGATTLAGYHKGGIVRELCEQIGVELDVLSTPQAITIMQNNKTCLRYRDLATFISEMERFYPHPKHAEFWNLIHNISNTFYAMDGFWYSNRSTFSKLRSLLSYFPLLRAFWPYLHGNGRDFIRNFYGTVSDEFIDFLDAQILIVAQTTSDKINFFTAALALGYTFNETYYPVGGMGAVCEKITSKLTNIRLGYEVKSIDKINGIYYITTPFEIIIARNLIMGTSHFESAKWFEDREILSYYSRYEKLNNYQSAFVVYLSLHSQQSFEHHYQLISEKCFPYSLSKSIFVSFSDLSDSLLSNGGEYSVTASIHTDERYWNTLKPTLYKKRKEEFQSLLKHYICDKLSIAESEIVQCFSATPKTFSRYINRSQLGGNAMCLDNLLPKLPSNDTPIRGFYHVGDTAYAAQGWTGVVMGVMNCERLIRG